MVGSPATIWAARTTRLPVMWAVNNPLRPRKPMMSVDPAIRLKTNGRARLARSAAADAVFSRRELLAERMLIRQGCETPALPPRQDASRAGGAGSCRGD